MRRRALLAVPLLAALPHPVFAAAPLPELRIGAGAAEALRLGQRLGGRVTAMPGDRVEALNRGHLELALLSDAGLAEARHRMGPRLAVLGTRGGLHLVSRAVLPPALHRAMAAAIG